MSEIQKNQVQPILPYNTEDSLRLITRNYYNSALPQIERIITTNSECKNMGVEKFIEGTTSTEIQNNKEAIEVCGNCSVQELCRLWATAEGLVGVVAGGVKTRVRLRDKAKASKGVSRPNEVEPAKVNLMRHALANRAYYLGMLSADDIRGNSF